MSIGRPVPLARALEIAQQIWQWLVPSPGAVWGLYRTDREYLDLHRHTRLQSLRVALWWERRARRSWVAARLGIDA